MCYVGPIQIQKRVVTLVYQLVLPPSISGLHNMFHVSQLKKYIMHLFQPLVVKIVELKLDLTFQCQPFQVIYHITMALRKKEIPLVNLVWEGSPLKEVAWELK